MLEIEVIGIEGIAVDVPAADELRFPTASELKGLCALAISSAGIEDGHVAIEFVDEDRIRELNLEYRQIDSPTDVLSFGIDEDGAVAGPRELGDIVICPAHTEDIREAVVHGALHLTRPVDGVESTCEFDQDPVARRLDQLAVVPVQLRPDHLVEDGHPALVGARLVTRHENRIAHNVDEGDGR